MAYPRGRALGGSGTINALAHVRGHRPVYDGWAAGGAAGLRVADASVMPAIPNAPLNATVLAIAERAAALVSGRAGF